LLKILRFKGGYAGESILRHYELQQVINTNVIWDKINESGRSVYKANKDHPLSWMADDGDPAPTDLTITYKELDNLIYSQDLHILKCHYYDAFLNNYNKFITDIICTNKFLPFVAISCIKKTSIIDDMYKFNKVANMLHKNNKELYATYVLYSIIYDNNIHNKTMLKQNTDKICLDDWVTTGSKTFNKDWYNINKNNIPSSEYINNYDNNLTLEQIENLPIEKHEKMSLLVLNNYKFSSIMKII